MLFISSQPFFCGFSLTVSVPPFWSSWTGMPVWAVRTWYSIETPSLKISCSHASLPLGTWDFSIPLRNGQNDGAESFVFPPPIFSASGIFFISPLISTGWGFFYIVGDGCWREWENFRACLGWSILYFISKYRVFLSLFIFAFPIPNKLFSL